MGTAAGGWRLAVGLSSVHFVQHVFRILPPVLPILALEFDYPLWQLGALVSVYFLGSGLGQTPVGILADRYDRRFVLPPFVGLMGVGYLVVALTPGLVDASRVALAVGDAPFTAGFVLMAAGTLVAGLGASAIHPVGYPLVATNAAAGATGRAYGVWGSAAKLGDAAAPTAVALLILVVAWDGIFLVFGVVGLAYAVGLYYAMSGPWIESRPASQRSGRNDVGSSGTGRNDVGSSGTGRRDAESPGTGRDAGTRSDGTIGPEPTGDTTDAPADGWRADPRHYVYPMVALLAFFVARAFSEKGLKTFLPTFLVVVYGYTFVLGDLALPAESFANLYFTAVFLVAAAVQLATGVLVDRYDHRAVLIAFLVGSALALLALATLRLAPLALLAVLAVLGATNWGWTPARDALIDDVTPPVREGRTFGYLHTVSHLVSAAAPVAIGYLAGRSGLRGSFVVLAATILVAVAAIGSLYSRRVYRPLGRGRRARSAED